MEVLAESSEFTFLGFGFGNIRLTKLPVNNLLLFPQYSFLPFSFFALILGGVKLIVQANPFLLSQEILVKYIFVYTCRSPFSFTPLSYENLPPSSCIFFNSFDNLALLFEEVCSCNNAVNK